MLLLSYKELNILYRMGAKGSKIILEDLPSVEGKVAIVTGGNIGS